MKKAILVCGVFFALVACNEQPKEEISIETEEEKTSQYLLRGQEISAQVFGVLSSELKEAMTKNGPDSALKYCNVNVIPITDSLSKVLNAEIKRTSLKVRNPQNEPSEIENEWLQKFNDKTQTDAIIIAENDLYHYFSPIYTAPLCLKCHGNVGNEIEEKNYQTIKALYPSDEATGFSSGDLRGMWSITFKK